MKENWHKIRIRIVKLLNPIFMIIPFVVGWILYYQERLWKEPFYQKGNTMIFVLYIVVYMTYGHIYDSFLISQVRISELIYSQCLAAFITNAAMYVITWLLFRHIPAPAVSVR